MQLDYKIPHIVLFSDYNFLQTEVLLILAEISLASLILVAIILALLISAAII